MVQQSIIEKRLVDFVYSHSEWSQKTFGSDQERGPLGALKHLEKEAKEAQEDPGDISEYADIFILLLDATRRAGWSFENLLTAVEKKMEVNKQRKWAKPNGDEPVEHIEEEDK